MFEESQKVLDFFFKMPPPPPLIGKNGKNSFLGIFHVFKRTLLEKLGSFKAIL